MGVDNIITDYPQRLRRFLEARNALSDGEKIILMLRKFIVEIECPFDIDLSLVPSLSVAGIRFESDFDGVQRDGDKLYLTGEKDIFDFYNAGLKIVFQFK